MRYVYTIVFACALGIFVHFISLLTIPSVGRSDAFSRMSGIFDPHQFATLPAVTPENSFLPFLDPSFVWAVCRFDLRDAPVAVSAPVTPYYTALTFYDPYGVAFYAINDRSAGRESMDLELMTPFQRVLLPNEDVFTQADRLIIEAPQRTGLIVLKALTPQRGQREAFQLMLRQARCDQAPFDLLPAENEDFVQPPRNPFR